MIEITGIPFPRLQIDTNNDFHNLWKRLYHLNDKLQIEQIKRMSIDWSEDKIRIEFESGGFLVIDVDSIFKFDYNGETF